MKDILINKKHIIDIQLINKIILIAKNAGKKIMQVYQTEFDVKLKEDLSPVTKADQLANEIITKELNALDIKNPILSEEGRNIDYLDRKNWDMYWLVDPLDGTKEFIKRNGDFTVNIALIKGGEPKLGVVYAPAKKLLFWGANKLGSWRQKNGENAQQIKVSKGTSGKIKIGTSRSHNNEKINLFLSKLSDYELFTMGSSLKICRVADGSIHIYPRLGPTMEWDTAAAHAILKSAGGDIIDLETNSRMVYNKKNLLNNEFLAGNIKIINKLKVLT
tara:strand:+ start:146 stop:970 length:825 start_codon:yes stop_codon:yes gene_type:complete